MKFDIIESQDGLGFVYLDEKLLCQVDGASDFFLFLDKFEDKVPNQTLFNRIFIEEDLEDETIEKSLTKMLNKYNVEQ